MRPSFLALAAILALAAAVRCQHLGALSFEFDEAFCWKMTTFGPGEIAHRAALDNHPPLYFYLLWAWSKAWGDSPLALRSLSVLFGLASVAGAYLLVRQMVCGARQTSVTNALRGAPSATRDVAPPLGGTARSPFPTETRGEGPHPSPLPEGEGENCHHPSRLPEGEGAALAAAALMALGPFQVDFSQCARMGYSLGAALTVVSSWLLLRALQAERPRWRAYLPYALAATALAYSHYFGLFVLAAQALYAAGCVRGPRRDRTVAPTLRGGVARSPMATAVPVTECRDYFEGPRPNPSANAEGKWLHRGPLPEGAGESKRNEFRSTKAHVAGALAIVALLCLPWAPMFVRQQQQVSRLFHTQPFSWREVAKATYQTLATRWEDEPPSTAVAWGATTFCLASAGTMLLWGRGGLRLLGLGVLVTFDGAVCASIGDRNIIQSRYFLFANALLVCGLPALVAQLRWPSPRPSPGGRQNKPSPRPSPGGRGNYVRGAALALLTGAAAWLCLLHAERRDGYAQRPGMRAAMIYLAEARQADEPVIVSNPLLQITAAANVERNSFPLADGLLPEGGEVSPRPSPLPKGGGVHPHPGPLPEGEGEEGRNEFRSTTVLVLGESGAFPYFQGTAVMRAGEFISREALAASPARRLWVVDAVDWIAPAWTVDLPAPWIEVSHAGFPEWVSATSQIIVRCYERPARTKRSVSVLR